MKKYVDILSEGSIRFYRTFLSKVFGPIGVAVIALGVIGLTTYPFLDRENQEFRARERAVEYVVPRVLSFVNPDGAERQVVTISVNLFVDARVIVSIVGEHSLEAKQMNPVLNPPASFINNYYVVPEEATFEIRWDILIFAAGFVIIALVGVRTIGRQTQSVPPVRSKQSEAGKARLSTAETYLVDDVQRALERSEELFSRSTLLLVGGVVLAFVGVGVFFISLPGIMTYELVPSPVEQLAQAEIIRPTKGASLTVLGISGQELMQSFRATAMLIFIEAIAWFLLRQYRALIEDYKSFYRYYMRRANYLISFKVAQSNKELIAMFVKTLLEEDLSGRLKKNETTEGLEVQKVTDANFAETIVTKTTEVAKNLAGKGKQKKTANVEPAAAD